MMKTRVALLAALALVLINGGSPSAAAGELNLAPGQAVPPPTTPPSSRREAAGNWTEDGLEKAQVKGLDVVYVRPGASLAEYRTVMVMPVSVSFRRNWERNGGASGSRIRPQDAQRIRDRLGLLVQEEMTKELAAGGFTAATAPGDQVLVMELAISDLDVTAPDVPTIGRTNVYALSAGEMTLLATLRDSVSGEVLVRVYDHERARESPRMQRITNIENAVEARHMAGTWAAIFRRQLELARGAR